MKVLTVNCYFPIYSTGKIIKSIEDELKNNGVEFFHCYEAGDKCLEPNALRLSGWFEYRVYYYLTRITGNRYGTGLFSTKKLLNKISTWKPDVVHIHCPNASSVNLYKLLDYLKKNDVPTVITHHAEFFYTGNCPHANDCIEYLDGCRECENFHRATESYFFNRTAWAFKKMKASMEGAKFVSVCVSKWQAQRCKNSVICGKLETIEIGNGIDTQNVFYYKKNIELEKKYKPNNEKIILHVTANFTDDENSPKGGMEIVKLAKMYQSNENVKIIVVGPYNLTKDESKLKNIIFIGKVQNQETLSQFYSLADVTVLTSKRETFGMVCAESMCCGTPVVGYQCGGTETIAIEKYSEFVPWGNLEKLFAGVCKWMEMDVDKERISQEAHERYSMKEMAKQYKKLYDSIKSRTERKD